jgi:hypothetical protein
MGERIRLPAFSSVGGETASRRSHGAIEQVQKMSRRVRNAAILYHKNRDVFVRNPLTA